MNQSQFLAITFESREAREKSRVHCAIGFGFASHWLKNWRDSLKPITKRSNRNHVITFDSHLKTTLMNQSEFLAFTCDLRRTREKWCVVLPPFGLKTVTKRSNGKHVMTFINFESLLKTAPSGPLS